MSARFSLALVLLTVAASPAAAQDDAFDVDAVLRGQGATLGAAEVVERAVETAPSLEAAERSVRAVEAGVQEAWAAIVPTVQITARYTRLSPIENDPLVSGLGGGAGADQLVAGVDDPEAQQLWAASLAQQQALGQQRIPVFLDQFAFDAVVQLPVSELFLSLLPRLEAAEAAVDAEEARVEVTRQRLRLRAREAYYGTLRARALVALSAQRVTELREQVRLATAGYDAGVTRTSERLGAQAQLAQAEAASARAAAGLSAAREGLRTLLHLPAAAPVAVGEDLTGMLPAQERTLAVLTDLAFERRAESRALELGARAQRRGQAAAEGARLPSLRVAFGAQVANPNPRFVPQRDAFDATWDLSVVLAWSPNQTIAADARASAAGAQAARLEAERLAFADAVRVEVANAWAADHSAGARLTAARAGVDAAEEAYRARQAERAAGQANVFDVLEAETTLSQARLGWVDAAVDARLARARLAYATADAVEAP